MFMILKGAYGHYKAPKGSEWDTGANEGNWDVATNSCQCGHFEKTYYHLPVKGYCERCGGRTKPLPIMVGLFFRQGEKI